MDRSLEDEKDGKRWVEYDDRMLFDSVLFMLGVLVIIVAFLLGLLFLDQNHPKPQKCS